MNLGIIWPKLFPALICLVLYAAVRRVRHLIPLRFIALIVGAMLARDLLFSIVPEVTVYPLADLVIMTLYVLWLRAYTGRKGVDIAYLALNCVIFAAGIVSIFFPVFSQSEFVLSAWILVNVAYFAVLTGLVSAIDTEKADIILRSRALVAAGLFIVSLVTLLYGYDYPLVQGAVIPASYLIPAWLLINYNAVLHGEGAQSIQFYSSNLDATYGFMENLGNAITAKIDLSRVLEIIITAAVKNIGADAGAILMVDEYEDILHVKATYGIFPPLGPVPELARVTPSSLKRYFAETPIPIGETVLGETVRSGKSILIRDARQDERMSHNLKDDILFVSSLAAIPLLVRNRVLGVLSVLKRAENQFFEERDFQQLNTLAEYASITIDNLYTYTEVLEKREIEREVDIAAQIQRKLLPARLPELESAALAVYNMPAKGVSGDYYDVFRLDNGSIAIAICDVAGKGIPAALVMVMIRSILHLIVSSQRDAATTLNWINRGITGRIDLDHFATIAFLIYDQKRREILYSNAAHLPLLVHRHRTGTTFKVDTEGLPIGIEKDARYEQKRFAVEKGDLVVLCTDGILEAMNPAGKQYGLGGLKRMVEKNAILPAAELVDAIREDLRLFVGTARQHDDQTLLLLKAL
jgi:phosphoserine phosphatase RsbU/P